MLISPVLGILIITNSPRLLKSNIFATDSIANQDTITKQLSDIEYVMDSIPDLDSLEEKVHNLSDTIKKTNTDIGINIKNNNGKESFSWNEKPFYKSLLISFLLGLIFSLPYKIYFRRKRKSRSIPTSIENFVRKTVLYSPLILATIIAIPFIVQNINLINKLFIAQVFVESFQQKMNLQYWAIFLLAGMLTIAFVYFWQKHNVQIVYLHHIFSKEELKRRIFREKSGKIRNRLVFASFITTLLPLSIVVAYLLMSLTSLSDIGLYEPTQGEFKVIFGEYYQMVKDNNVNKLMQDYNLSYINVFDTFLLFIGIGAGIFVTIIYILYFVHWTNSGIVKPVKELLYNMQKTTGGQLENFSTVRTNDELGNLSENYNIMTSKLHEYIAHIDKMNAELEEKVRERTAEIQSQKEEIEAQRDEVESQRDEIERQRDYVIEQRDLISQQKKAITDSIEYAANIQSAILPPIEIMNKILKNYFVYFKPRDIVSGDFFWAHQIKKKGENQVIIVAADSTGHGVPGAFMSMLGITLLNEIIVKKGIHSPAEILDNLKDNVVNSLHQTNEIGKSKDGIDLAVCMIDFNRKNLEYAGAYNPVYIVREKDSTNFPKPSMEFNSNGYRIDKYGTKTLIEIKADKNPIGISHKQTKKYNQFQFSLESNDVLYMFSDGYADQFGGDRRLKFMYSKFKELLAGISSESMEKQYELINGKFLSWKGSEKQIDDILVMGIRIN
jgi:serine phosphatase RsbU (regulator of sigma subunit)